MTSQKKTLLILLLFIALLLSGLNGCSQSRQPETARKPSAAECQAVTRKAEAKRLYDEINNSEMTVFDGVSSRDPKTIDARVLHRYLVLDKYAKDRQTTLSRMTPAERRQVLLDDAIRNEGASNTELTPDERKIATQCTQ